MRPSNEALVVIDVQNDFCPGGHLAVPEGEQIVAPINALVPEFAVRVFTQDWHPSDHLSFASQHGADPMTTTEMPYGTQVLWPDHCVQGSDGAAHPVLAAASLAAGGAVRPVAGPGREQEDQGHDRHQQQQRSFMLVMCFVNMLIILGFSMVRCYPDPLFSTTAESPRSPPLPHHHRH